MTSLTKAVMDYKKTQERWEELVNKICLYAYEFPGRWTDWDEDKCSDFFLAFLPRIPRLVRRFEPRYSFETYLSSSLRWFMKTYTETLAENERYLTWSSETAKESRIHAIENAITENLPPIQMESSPWPSSWPEDYPFALNENGALENEALRRRFIFLLLLHASEIDCEHQCMAARLAGVDEEWLQEKLNWSRRITIERQEKKERLREKRNECWYKLSYARSRLSCEMGDSLESWAHREAFWAKRHSSACEAARHYRVSPTHEEIAQLLGTATGTVSSGLFILRDVWQEMEQKGRPPERLCSHPHIPSKSKRKRKRPRPSAPQPSLFTPMEKSD